MTWRFTNCARHIATLALICLALTMEADTATSKTFPDYQAATNSSLWEAVNDDMMGGVSFDSPLYQSGFTTKQGEWEVHRLAFSEFVPTFRGRVLTDVPPLNPAKVNSVGFLIADKQAGPFRLEIGWIKASPANP